MSKITTKTLFRKAVDHYYVTIEEEYRLSWRVVLRPAGQPAGRRKKADWVGVKSYNLAFGWHLLVNGCSVYQTLRRPGSEAADNAVVLGPHYAEPTRAERKVVIDVVAEFYAVHDLYWWPYDENSALFLRRRRCINEKHAAIKRALEPLGLLHRRNGRFWVMYDKPMTLETIEEVVINGAAVIARAEDTEAELLQSIARDRGFAAKAREAGDQHTGLLNKRIGSAN
jgi:hypothetical protein